MALFGIGKTKVSLKLFQNGKTYEAVCKDITLTRQPNAASRLTTSIRRDQITAECGDLLKLTIDEQHNQFFGVITDTSKSGVWCDVTAYDQIFYMNKSHISYIYEQTTAKDLLITLTKKLGLKMVDPPHVMETDYVIPYRIEDNATPLDIILTAIDLTYKNTGKRFYLWDDCGNLCLHDEEWLMKQCHIVISMGYIEDYSYKEDMNDVVTRVKIISDKTTKDDQTGTRTLYVASNDEAQSKYGLIEYMDTLEEGENGEQKAKTILEGKNGLTISLSISGCQGDIVVRGGTPVYVDFFSQDNAEYIRGFFRTESVTHHIGSGYHTMDLELSIIEMYNNWDDRDIGKSIPGMAHNEALEGPELGDMANNEAIDGPELGKE